MSLNSNSTASISRGFVVDFLYKFENVTSEALKMQDWKMQDWNLADQIAEKEF